MSALLLVHWTCICCVRACIVPGFAPWAILWSPDLVLVFSLSCYIIAFAGAIVCILPSLFNQVVIHEELSYDERFHGPQYTWAIS